MRSAVVRLSILAVGVLIGVLLAAAGGAGAEQSSPSAKAAAAAKPKPVRGPRGPRGYRGPRGFTGPVGGPGPVGPSGATKVLYRGAADSSALQSFFSGQGFVLEASCTTPFVARIRSTANDGHLVMSGMDATLTPFFVTEADFDTGETRSLYQNSGPAKTEVQGMLVLTTPTAAAATVVYAIDFDSVVGACVVTGTLSPAP